MKIRRSRSSTIGFIASAPSSAASGSIAASSSSISACRPRSSAFSASTRLPPEPIDRPVAGGRRDPGARVVRDAPGRPRLEGRDEGLLDGFLGKVEVTEDADQGGHRPPLLLAEQAVDDGVGVLGASVKQCGSAAIVGRQPPAPALARGSASAIAYSAGSSQIGRTSIEPSVAAGIFAAVSIASSRSRASIR